MAKYTERLDIKMTSEDMYILAEKALKADKPLTVYARELILQQINPLLREGRQDEGGNVETNKSSPVAKNS